MQKLLSRSQATFNASMIGRTLPVLFERPGRHANQLLGRTAYGQWVHADMAEKYRGRIADILITEAHANSLAGQAVLAHAGPTTETPKEAAAHAEGQPG